MTKKLYLPFFIVTVCLCIFQTAVCSLGDRSNAFQNCMHWCSIKNCSNSSNLAKFEASRPWYLSFLHWECWDECDHFCMWHAVKVFQYHGEAIPQFHGKVSVFRLIFVWLFICRKKKYCTTQLLVPESCTRIWNTMTQKQQG